MSANDKNRDRFIFILSKEIGNAEAIKNKLEQRFNIKQVIISDDLAVKSLLKEKPWMQLFYKNVVVKNLSPTTHPIDPDSVSEINIFIDCTPTSRLLLYLFKKATFNLLEDGYSIYAAKQPTFFAKVKNYLIYRRQKYGRDQQIRKIWVESPEKLPVDLQQKAQKWPVDEILQNLSSSSKIAVFKFFLERDVFTGQSYEAMLLTQPFSEDGFISEAEKIAIYRRIFDEFSLNKKQVLIKPHPREQTDYSKVFANAVVVREIFPIEILNFIEDLQIKQAITVSSSAIYNMDFAEKKVFLGLEYHAELERKFLRSLS